MATQETFFDMCLCFSLLWNKHCKDLDLDKVDQNFIWQKFYVDLQSTQNI